MAEQSTVARPYAKAVFELAQESGTLAQWSESLRFLSAMMDNARLRELVSAPGTTSEELTRLVLAVAGDRLDEHGTNLVRLMVQNRRLAALAELSTQFEALRAEAEGAMDVELTTSVAIDDAYRSRITSVLQQRFGRTVRLQCKVDAHLLGGAVITAGDTVIDGSLRGRLDKLASSLAR